MIDLEYLRKHYAGLSDEALKAVDRRELLASAQAVYDGEMERRYLSNDEALPDASAASVGSLSPGLRRVKRAALAACVATVLGMALPMWNFMHQILALESRIGKLGALTAIFVLYAFLAITPFFYFALYRNEGDLPMSSKVRWMSITAAAMMAILSVASIPEWMGSFRHESMLDSSSRPWTIGDTSTALGQIANIAGILLLAAFFRLSGDSPSEIGVAVSRLLRLLSKIAVIAGGIVVAGCVIGIAATPWIYSYIRDRSSEMGSTTLPWTFSQFAVDRVRAALTVSCVYVAPFVVWRGTRMRTTSGFNST